MRPALTYKPARQLRRRSRSGEAWAVPGPCEGTVNFFASRSSARAWSEQHREVSGQVVDQVRAEEIGRQTFGPLLVST